MSTTVTRPIKKNDFSWGGPELSLLDVRIFLRGCASSARSESRDFLDTETVRDKVAHSEAFADFVNTRYSEIVSLFSDDYILLLDLLLVYGAEWIGAVDRSAIFNNFSFYKDQLLKSVDEKALAREMLLHSGDLGKSWDIIFPCILETKK